MKTVIERKGQFSEAFIETCRMNEQWANDALEYEDYDDIGTNEDIDTLVSDYSLDIKPDTKEYELFRTEYIKAFRDYNKSIVDFNRHYDEYSFSDHRTIQSITPKVPNVKLADVIDKYIQNGLQRRNWTEKTAKSYRSELDLILEYMGQDCGLYLTKQDMNAIADMLGKIPKNIKGIKGYESLSIDELMALDESKYPRMSLKNQKKYIANYAAFFKWAGREHDGLESEYFLRLKEDFAVDNEAVRDPFSPEQIHAMLDVLVHNKDGFVQKEHQKWGTLIGIYTGARLNEIAQLELDDIREIDGVPCFDINKDSKYNTKKKLKTKNSARIIPIHSDLTSYGFMAYVEKMRNKGVKRLFPELNYSANEDGYGRSISRWVNDRLLNHLNIKKENVVFHCFRHTVSDRLRNAGVTEEVVNAIVGHVNVGMGQQKYFKQGYKPQLLAEAMEKLNHRG